MIPRARLDIGFRQLALAATHSLLPGNADVVRARIESAWPRDAHNLACLSVRTGFDLLLQVLALPRGTEVLLSAVTIPDMARIVRAHGLVPVPVDIDGDTLVPTAAALERAVSPRSRVLVLAHLFGAWSDFSDTIARAHRHGLLVIEDIAQSAGACRYAGHAESDVRMFSFGPIKTDTALGGAIISFTDASLAARARAAESTYPVQRRSHYAVRVVRFAVLRAIATRAGMTLFQRACALAGQSYDDVIAKAARGFPGDELIRQLRRRPGGPLLAMLAHRLTHPATARVRRRAATGRAFLGTLGPHVRVPGLSTQRHTFWLFPVIARDPDAAIRALRAAGFDATRGATSIAVVDAPPERPELHADNARRMMDELLFLPVYPEADRASLCRLADLVNDLCVERDGFGRVREGGFFESGSLSRVL
jgi:perosamine synthetase